MAEFFFTKLNLKDNFIKLPAKCEIFVLFNPTFNQKHFIPVMGTVPLSPTVVDNNLHKYVVQAEKFLLLRNFDFVPCLKIEEYNTVFPFPEKYIYSKLTKKEKEIIETTARSCQNSKVEFFQIYVPIKG